jgi:hypothetical protein
MVTQMTEQEIQDAKNSWLFGKVGKIFAVATGKTPVEKVGTGFLVKGTGVGVWAFVEGNWLLGLISLVDVGLGVALRIVGCKMTSEDDKAIREARELSYDDLTPEQKERAQEKLGIDERAIIYKCSLFDATMDEIVLGTEDAGLVARYRQLKTEKENGGIQSKKDRQFYKALELLTAASLRGVAA